MKKTLFVSVMLFVFAALFAVPALAAERGTPAEAKALVVSAMDYFKTKGKDAAVAAFNDPKGQFVKKDLYIFLFDKAGVLSAHGGNKSLVGKSMLDKKDPDGKYYVKDMIAKADAGGGWVEYKFENPKSKKVEPKTSYVLKAGDLYLGCGAYLNQE